MHLLPACRESGHSGCYEGLVTQLLHRLPHCLEAVVAIALRAASLAGAAEQAGAAGGFLARRVWAPIACAEVRHGDIKAGLPDETLFPFKCVNQTAYGVTSFLRFVITIQI